MSNPLGGISAAIHREKGLYHVTMAVSSFSCNLISGPDTEGGGGASPPVCACVPSIYLYDAPVRNGIVDSPVQHFLAEEENQRLCCHYISASKPVWKREMIREHIFNDDISVTSHTRQFSFMRFFFLAF
jgi:hypothetical protein